MANFVLSNLLRIVFVCLFNAFFSITAFGRTLLQCLVCLLPFLDHDLVESLPYLTASLVAVMPAELHQEIINHLCFYVLPFTIGE